MVGDETIIQRAVDRIRDSERDRYSGPDRREPPPVSTVEYLKWLPLIVVAISAAVGYGSLQTKVESISEDVSELKRDMKEAESDHRETHASMWKRITE